MGKKYYRYIAIFFLLNVCLSVFAAVTYLQPMGGTNGIPMNPIKVQGGPGVTENIHYSKIEGYANKDGVWLDKADAPYQGVVNNALAYRKYTDQEIIAIGGAKFISQSSARDEVNTKVKMTANCDSGFYMVSQSNPNYKRPFQLYVIPKCLGIDGVGKKSEYYGKPRILDSTSYAIEFQYFDLPVGQKAYPWEDIYQMWFDLVLVLPGYVEQNVLKVDTTTGTELYPLTEADDYSALVTLSLQSEISGVLSSVETVTIPFSGFYKPEQQARDEASLSMYVHPTASAGNLDLKNYARQQIASIEVMSTHPYKNGSQAKLPETPPSSSFAVFLSSSVDPYEPGDLFELRKDNLSVDEDKTSYNSVNYSVVLVNNEDRTSEMKYDGSAALSKDNILKASNVADYDFLVLPGHKDFNKSHSYGVRAFNYSGTAYIEIKDNSGYMMEAGRYTSSVYVHVMNLL